MQGERYQALRARELGYRYQGVGKRYDESDIRSFVTAVEQRESAQSPLAIAQRLETYVPGFSGTIFFKRVDELLRPPDASVPLREANRLIDTSLQEKGTFIDITTSEDRGTTRIRRDLSYEVRLKEAMEKGLIDPVMLSLFQTAWAVLSITGGSSDRLKLDVSDFVNRGDDPSKVSPYGTKYELSVSYWVDYTWGDINLRVGPPRAALRVHSGYRYSVESRNQLDAMLDAINKTPAVINPLALSFTQTLVNPALLAIGQREKYPHYTRIVTPPRAQAA